MSNLSKFLTVLGFAAAIISLGGCSTNPATGQQSFTAFMSKERESAIGAEEHPKILKELGGAYMRSRSALISRVLDRSWRRFLNYPTFNGGSQC